MSCPSRPSPPCPTTCRTGGPSCSAPWRRPSTRCGTGGRSTATGSPSSAAAWSGPA
ncbi:hypothetical protein [Ornithinimicrobium kibberense]|uniref:hypothetical protein n=1 Tax=Ornithinimicrobium kibberense TaxID=282060 RepID=UPI00360DBF68